jgi:hypothetical protein
MRKLLFFSIEVDWEKSYHQSFDSDAARFKSKMRREYKPGLDPSLRR